MDGIYDNYLSAYFYSDDGLWTNSYYYMGYISIDIYQHTYVSPSVSRVWNASSIALFDSNFYTGASNDIPAYLPSLPEETNTLIDYMEDYSCLSVYYDNGSEREVDAYIAIIEENGYVLDEGNLLYTKVIEGKGTISIDVYTDITHAYNADYSFLGDEQPSVGTITVTSADLTGISSYASTTFSASNVIFDIENVMLGNKNGTKLIQIKKGVGVLTNHTALAPLASLTISQYTEGEGYDGTYSVYAGTSLASLTAVTGSDGVYDLNGATFFSIRNEATSYAVYLNSFSFTFKA